MSEPSPPGASGSLSREARIAHANELINRAFCPCDVDVHTRDDRFGVHIDTLSLGAIQVVDFRGSGVLEAHHQLRHVRAQDNEDIWFYLPRSARFLLTSGNERHMLGPAEFGFVGDGRPFSGCVYPGPDNTFAAWLVRIPATLFLPRLPFVDRYRHHPLTLDCAGARVTAGLLDALRSERGAWGGEAALALGESLVNAIVAAGHDAISRAQAHAPARARLARLRLRERVERYILARLGDASLDTRSIARDCGISLRGLHALFDDGTLTVSAWIRHQRLAHSRAMLRNRSADELTIIEIAMACGFNDAAHFAKAYRREFGVAPSEERKRAR